MVLIVINAIILGLETVPSVMSSYGSILLAVDHFILGIFVIEILLRIFAHRLGFFRDAWSIFDFTVVMIALVPASGPFAVLRALRVLRILTVVPSMRRVTQLDSWLELDRAGAVANLLRVCSDRDQSVRIRFSTVVRKPR